MKGDYFKCAYCGKLGFMQQWLIDEKLNEGRVLVCSHQCGISYYQEHPEEHPHTKYMIKEMKEIYKHIIGDENI